jgi:hypothetical protein
VCRGNSIWKFQPHFHYQLAIRQESFLSRQQTLLQVSLLSFSLICEFKFFPLTVDGLHLDLVSWVVLATWWAACGMALGLVCDFRWGYQNTKTDVALGLG